MFELSDWQRRAATQRFIDQALIGGRQRPAASGATFDAIDPASNRLLARVAACDAAAPSTKAPGRVSPRSSASACCCAWPS